MRLLLDTHVLLWWMAGDHRLPPAARTAIANPAHDVLVSAASAWEIGIKKALGKLSAPDDLPEQLTGQGFDALPVSVRDGLAAGALPRHHDDPFDRMLVAQAVNHGLVLATADRRIGAYDVPLLRLWE